MDVLILNRYYYHYYSSAFFIILPGQSHGYGNPPFQVLVTEKSARNNLVPANSPAHGLQQGNSTKLLDKAPFIYTFLKILLHRYYFTLFLPYKKHM